MNRLIIFVCKYVVISIFPFTSALLAQQVVSGRITDAEDDMPVPGASVFIANTTVGTTSDALGNYSLTVPGRGSFEIVVSHVGYQSVFHKIDMPKDTHHYSVALETNELEEITVTAAKTYRNRDVDLFWRKILGEKPSKKGLEVLNPEKVYYYLNSDNVLKISCKEPIEIINHETGYHIRYVLQSFQHDYRNNETVSRGISYFEELIPQNSRQKFRWENKRQEVYAVSLTRFFRALYREQIREEGFWLIYRDSLMSGKIMPVTLHDILKTGQDTALLTIREPLLLICYGEPNAGFQNRYRDIGIKDIITRGGKYPLVELPSQQITIFSDGSYKGLLEINEHRNPMSGLSSKLPIEYADRFPDIAQTSKLAEKEVDEGILAEKNMMAQLKAYPQEKIHLHTDRDYYVTGENIWFKAYVVDAHSYQFPTLSQYVYVELISPEDTLMSRVMIRQDDGMFHGHVPVPAVLPDGNYTLRAYTRYMENQGDDYFFKKNIRIENLASVKNQQQQNAQRSRSRKAQTEKEDYDVTFFPEGGNLLEGVFCKVAFKAINKNGYPEMVSGKITDENGAELASVETYYAGMGVFSYIPEMGKKLYLNCVNSNGVEKQFELPQPNPQAYSLAASVRGKRIIIGVQKSIHAPVIPCYLLVHCQGRMLYFTEWDKAVTLMEEELPAGIVQFVLFDGQMNPLSERLIFSKNNASEKVEFQTDKEVYEKREKVSASLQTPSLSGWAGEGPSHFSIAITDDQDVAIDESTTILSSLLLSSELKGYIENPAYYLQDATAMDYLMMTHGWRRYNIPEVVKGNLEYPQIPFQLTHEITGQVKNRVMNNPVPGSEISLVTQGEARITSTDKNGFFTFQDVDFTDSTFFYIQALNAKGNDNVKIDINDESFPGLVYAPQSPVKETPAIVSEDKLTTVTDSEVNGATVFMEKAEQRAMYDEDLRIYHIEEITITAPKINPFEEPRLRFYANKYSDKTITREEIEKYHFSSIYDCLRVTAGAWVNDDGSVKIRGEGGRPVILIDGIEQDWPDELNHPSKSPLERVPFGAIESIDIFKGFGATMFGMRGANGAISITTKRGGDSGVQSPKFNYAIYSPLGYQKPAEFYSPKYETLEAKRSVIPDLRTTIFWKPNVVISEEGKVTFEFYTSDFRTTYSVVIEGITSDGRIVREVGKIRVE